MRNIKLECGWSRFLLLSKTIFSWFSSTLFSDDQILIRRDKNQRVRHTQESWHGGRRHDRGVSAAVGRRRLGSWPPLVCPLHFFIFSSTCDFKIQCLLTVASSQLDHHVLDSIVLLNSICITSWNNKHIIIETRMLISPLMILLPILCNFFPVTKLMKQI